jgi:RNA recognition motif-containing protein
MLGLADGVFMSQKIYVGNLASSVVTKVLTDKFAKFGIVNSIKIIKDRETNRSMGFAFVEMVSSEDAEKAILNLNGTLIEGKLVNVTEAQKSLLH